MEWIDQFEERKKDHIQLALDDRNEAIGHSGLDQIELWHEALPDIDFKNISLHSKILGLELMTPLLISSMTAGHGASPDLNQKLMEACQARGWMMGVGSQRRELFDAEAVREWRDLRRRCPKAILFGNIGLSQLIGLSIDDVKRLADGLEASAMIIHTNPLQECLQLEGTPSFAGGLVALKKLCEGLDRPVILKETGSGFSPATMERLRDVPLGALDISGFGGTHWGRVEGARHAAESVQAQASLTFSHWGVSTAESLITAVEKKLPFEIWASGGIRSGLDGARVLAVGAVAVGFAKPVLEAVLQGEAALNTMMQKIEFELRCAMFCTGCVSIEQLKQKGRWRWRKN